MKKTLILLIVFTGLQSCAGLGAILKGAGNGLSQASAAPSDPEPTPYPTQCQSVVFADRVQTNCN